MKYYFNNQSDINSQQLQTLADRFVNLTSMEGLCRLLGVTEQTLAKHILKPEYQTFHIPKPGGKKRLIQHPGSGLKAIQQTLNKYLQAVYYTVRSESAHGFIICPTDDLQPRNIYTNALAHRSGEWLLNIDFKDFFHTITTTHLKNLFRHLFFFSPELTTALTTLTTWQSRLPMGAPTSPVLSNLVCLNLDYQMEQLALQHSAVYTRYADDITFSFRTQPSPDWMKDVMVIVLQNGFTIQQEKMRLQTRMEKPEITGLVMGDGPLPSISKAWLKRLKEEIRIFRWLMSEAVKERGLFHVFVFDKFKQSVTGQIAFVGFMLGKDSREYRKLMVKVGG